MANLRDIRDIKSAEIEIKDETGKPMGVFFEIAGPTHPARKRLQFERSRRNVERFQKAGKVELPDPEEAEQLARSELVAYTIGWRGYTDDAGAVVPFSAKAAEALYADPEMEWLADQLQTAAGERERFIRRLPRS